MRPRIWIVLPLLCLLSCSPADKQSADAATRMEDEAALKALTTSFDAATNARNIDAMMSRYAEGAVRMDPNAPTASGRDAIRQLFLERWAANNPVVGNQLVDFRISGNLAVSRGTWTATFTPASDKTPYEDRGKWVGAAERQADGSWKSIWEIWSSDLPPRNNP